VGSFGLDHSCDGGVANVYHVVIYFHVHYATFDDRPSQTVRTLWIVDCLLFVALGGSDELVQVR